MSKETVKLFVKPFKRHKLMSHLSVGDQAPDFQGIDQHGKSVNLSDYRGQKVILYFYPKDDTPGCTKEACNLRDHYEQLQQHGFQVLGVSIDDVHSHEQFASKYELPFRLVADPEKTIVDQYGVYGEKNSFGKKKMGTKRTTFVIDEQGQIEHIFRQVKSEDHAQQILDQVHT
jgi:peroxiredoxin Q/BCP